MAIVVALTAVAFVPEDAVVKAGFCPTVLAFHYWTLVARMNLTTGAVW